MKENGWATWANAALDLLFPPRCEVCGELGRPAFCPQCQEAVLMMLPPFCRLCGAMQPPAAEAQELCPDCRSQRRYYDGARSVGLHHGTLRRAILNFKFNNRRRLEEPLARLLYERLRQDPLLPRPLPVGSLEAIVPIPLHPARRAWRGFDQCQRLCLKLGDLTGLEVLSQSLRRVKPTAPQVDLTPRQRAENMRGAFAVQGDALRGRRLLLVDDVYTTGATAHRAAQACRTAGATAIYVLTLSRPAPGWHPAALSREPGESREAVDQRQGGN